MPDLKPLIGYIIDQVKDQGGDVGKTALVKLVYLIDVEYYRGYEKSATGLRWKFHHYGPYSAELESAINNNRFVEMFGGRGSRYRFSKSEDWREIHRNYTTQFTVSVRRVVDNVIRQWGLEPLETLLDYVYFETEPMQGAERGRFLDFSTIQKRERVTPNASSLTFPDGFLADLRSRWEQREKPTFKEPRVPDELPYDQVTEDALQAMADEEHLPFNIPHGTDSLGHDRERST